jgi:glucose-6-phosphate 1-dehydrogenase
MSDDDFRAMAATAIRRFSRRAPDPDVLEALLEGACFVPGSFDDPNTYAQLQQALAGIDNDAAGPLNRVLYLSTAPLFFPLIVERLGEYGLNRRPDADVRIVIEKPFGTDLAEARRLNRRVLAVFDESQVFRIDHYLVKETVQNLLAFRFANSLFEPAWSRNTIQSVQITAAEEVGVEGRAGYYDRAGALRDLVQNHLLQLLCHVAMEPPVDFSADEVRNEKVKVLRAIHPPAEDEVDAIAVRAQYGPGVVGGEPVPGYVEEPGVPPDSTTETYAALRLEVESWRWAGVPFYLRTGKRLARKLTEIAMQLRPVPHLGFLQDGSVGAQPNQLIMTIQPDEGVSLSLAAKIPGTGGHAHPPGADAVPVRQLVPVGVPGGLRTADPRRHARRCDAVHAQRRGRGAMAHLRPDRRRLGGAAGAAAAVRSRLTGAGRGAGAAARGPPMARDLIEENGSR